MDNNICKFIKTNHNESEINIINFVYEKEPQTHNNLRCETLYKMHLVTCGKGTIRTASQTYDLTCGDIFFTFPAMSYSIESKEDFKYIYISYIGLRTNCLMDKLNITKNNFIFSDFSHLIRLWTDSITDENSIIELRCEGLLLYSFSMLNEKLSKEIKTSESLIVTIKKYIDENFCDNTISLKTISQKYSYNEKYLSSYFKKNFGIGISGYITLLRIQKACDLIEQGCTSVKSIAYQCGFSDPFYFSNVFKKKLGISPKEHIRINNTKSK